MKKPFNASDIGIIAAIIGMVASLVIIVMNFIEHESKSVGIVLFCSCAATLATNVRNKRNNK